jgi:hypothetical protein
MGTGNPLGIFLILLIFLFVIIGLWFILREFICWYYKINERISLQKRTNELLEQLINKNKVALPANKPSAVTAVDDGVLGIYSDEKQNHGFICFKRESLNGFMWPEAKRFCADCTEGGFTNWRLPTKDELQLIFENLHMQGKGAFSNGTYWSSTEIDIYNSWAQNFQNGEQVESGKSSFNLVCAVRSF